MASRTLLDLYASDHVRGTSPSGGPRKPGVRTRLALTDKGRAAVAEIRRLAEAA